MAQPITSDLDSRREQRFPILSSSEIERLSRFGDPRRYPAGSQVVQTGEPTEGLLLVLAGEIAMLPSTRPDRPIVIHGPGAFLGELAQLSGRPSLVDGVARADVSALVIIPSRLRELMIQEAELGELIMRALILRRVELLQDGIGGPVIIGPTGSRDVLRLQDFLRRNGHPFQWLDPATEECAKALIERFDVPSADLPIVQCSNGELLRNPTESELGRCIGLSHAIDGVRDYDVAIIGAGPAGLAAAVYAASEGLSVIQLDCRSFGGQAGASARIENYLGFPTGISGMALMGRAYNQAQKFGVDFVVPEEVVGLACRSDDRRCRYVVELASGQTLGARAVVIATGAKYRRLELPGLEAYEGTHVHYWASPLEARLCVGQEVVLVGAGNSAGQAAAYLASHTRKVWLIVRGPSLTASMSHYLCDRIAAQPNIEVLLETEVVDLKGEGGELHDVLWRRADGKQQSRQVSHLFLFIGAVPSTGWLARSGIELDPRGFVVSAALAGNGRRPLETNLPGVFAIGDVRAGSVKRVASSVGEGAQVVAAIHSYLADLEDPSALAVPEGIHA